MPIFSYTRATKLGLLATALVAMAVVGLAKTTSAVSTRSNASKN